MANINIHFSFDGESNPKAVHVGDVRLPVSGRRLRLRGETPLQQTLEGKPNPLGIRFKSRVKTLAKKFFEVLFRCAEGPFKIGDLTYVSHGGKGGTPPKNAFDTLTHFITGEGALRLERPNREVKDRHDRYAQIQIWLTTEGAQGITFTYESERARASYADYLRRQGPGPVSNEQSEIVGKVLSWIRDRGKAECNIDILATEGAVALCVIRSILRPFEPFSSSNEPPFQHLAITLYVSSCSSAAYAHAGTQLRRNLLEVLNQMMRAGGINHDIVGKMNAADISLEIRRHPLPPVVHGIRVGDRIAFGVAEWNLTNPSDPQLYCRNIRTPFMAVSCKDSISESFNNWVTAMRRQSDPPLGSTKEMDALAEAVKRFCSSSMMVARLNAVRQEIEALRFADKGDTEKEVFIEIMRDIQSPTKAPPPAQEKRGASAPRRGLEARSSPARRRNDG